MSGGSFSYLCYKEPQDLFDCEYMESLERMEAYLITHGYEDIARDTRRLIEYVKSAENRISVLQEQLADVFHAVEWYVSADYGRDTLEKHLEAYRKGEKTK